MSDVDADASGVRKECSNCGQTNRIPLRHLTDTGRCGKCKTPLDPLEGPIDADLALFDALLRDARAPVLVDFWAAWCGPCRVMAPELEKLARSQKGSLIVVKVDTERFPELSQRYSIEALPTLVLFRDGQVQKRLAGARPAAAIARELAL
jgi:thioredoxin 2